jgi:methyl-accepting chemotaxis protein
MKKIIYAITGFSFSLAAALGIIVSILGIVFVWRQVPGTTERLVNTAIFAQRALDSTDDLLAVADSTLTQAEDNIALIADATQDVAETLKQTSTITTTVADAVGDEFTSVVDKTQTALGALESSAKLVDDTLSFISSIPLLGAKYSNQTPLYSSVVEINESLDEMPKTLKSLQDSLDSTANAFTGLNDSVSVLADNVAEIETSMKDAVAVVNRYQVLVDEAQVKTENMIEKLPRWISWTAIGLTVLLVWLIVIQAGLLMFGAEMAGLKRGQPEDDAKIPSLVEAEPETKILVDSEEKVLAEEKPAEEKKKKKKSK